MRFRTVGNKYDVAFVVVRNSLTAKTMPQGAPVFYVMNGTNDGLDVTDANTAAGAGEEMIAGIVGTNGGIPPNQYGEAQVFGLCQSTRVVTFTRTTSTDSYNSFTAIATFDIYQVNTLTGVDAVSRSGAGSKTAAVHNILAVQAYTSTASQSSSFDTTSRTAVTTTLKTFLRIL
jgi:hypothetical protein